MIGLFLMPVYEMEMMHKNCLLLNCNCNKW